MWQAVSTEVCGHFPDNPCPLTDNHCGQWSRRYTSSSPRLQTGSDSCPMMGHELLWSQRRSWSSSCRTNRSRRSRSQPSAGHLTGNSKRAPHEAKYRFGAFCQISLMPHAEIAHLQISPVTIHSLHCANNVINCVESARFACPEPATRIVEAACHHFSRLTVAPCFPAWW